MRIASYILIFLLSLQSSASPTSLSSCNTTTTLLVVPTTTYTWRSTAVITIDASAAKDLGTFTQVVADRTTHTIKTLTKTVTDCFATKTFTGAPVSTIYTTGRIVKRQASPCTIIVTSTTTYGATYSWIAANETSTYTRYTAFTLLTVTSTTTGGTSYTIHTVNTTTCKACGPTSTPTGIDATTTTQDARCAPTAIVSAAGQHNGSEGFGILYLNQVPYGGATFSLSTMDASGCCQQCIEDQDCAASAWDIRTNECQLMFAVQWDTGVPSCANGALAFYNYGPNHPMPPGTGWYLAYGCGYFQTAGAKPDDGS